MKSGSKSSLLRILGAVGFVLAVVFLTVQQANFLLSRAMLIAFGDSETTYKSAWFEWDGDIVAKNVVIYPYNLGEDITIGFERVHLETPGWFWFVRNTFDRKLKFAKMDRIHLTLEGGHSDTGFDPSLGDLGPFGLDSASPFEAEGCATDGMWVREELVQMGLDPGPPKLEFDYRVEGNALLTTISLEVQGASRVQLDRTAQLPTRVNALLMDQYPHLVESERWQVQDQGFVQARNRHCAKKDGIDERTFVARHVATVSRLLETAGITVDGASREAYQAFARRGGNLVFGGSYAPAIHSEEFYDLRDTGEAWVLMRNATLARDQQQVAVQWQHFEPRLLEGLDDANSTWEAMRRERPAEATVPASTTAAPTAAFAAGTAAGATPSAAAGATPPVAASTAPPVAASTAVPPQAAASASAGAGARASAASVAAAPATGSAAPPRITVAAPPARVETFLAWKDMAAYEGQRVRLWTRRNPPRLVQVLSFDGDSLRIATRLGGGSAEYTVQRNSFLRARALR